MTSLPKAAVALRYIAILNFFAMVTAMIHFGGDAMNGHEDGGRYFLSWHGRLTEVSGGVYMYSRLHMYLAFGLCVAAAVSVFFARPGLAEQRVQGRLIVGLGMIMAAYAYLCRA